MPLRPVTPDDAEALAPFVAMAAFPPGAELSLETPHAARWLEGWGDEVGVVWEADCRVLGAAWARVVEPVLVRDERGCPVPEAIIAVVPDARGRGIGGRLLKGLLARVETRLAVTVSERNPVALRLYERAGFEHAGRTPTGLLVLLRSAP